MSEKVQEQAFPERENKCLKKQRHVAECLILEQNEKLRNKEFSFFILKSRVK